MTRSGPPLQRLLVCAAATGFILSLLFGVLVPLVYLPGVLLGGSVTWGIFTLVAFWYLHGFFEEREDNIPDDDQKNALLVQVWDTPQDVVTRFTARLEPRRYLSVKTLENGSRELAEEFDHDDVVEGLSRKHPVVLLAAIGPLCILAVMFLVLFVGVIIFTEVYLPLNDQTWAVLWRAWVFIELILVLSIIFRGEAWRHTVIGATKFRFVVAKLPPSWLWFLKSYYLPYEWDVIKSCELLGDATNKTFRDGTLKMSTLLQPNEEKKISPMHHLPYPKEWHGIIQGHIGKRN